MMTPYMLSLGKPTPICYVVLSHPRLPPLNNVELLVSNMRKHIPYDINLSYKYSFGSRSKGIRNNELENVKTRKR